MAASCWSWVRLGSASAADRGGLLRVGQWRSALASPSQPVSIRERAHQVLHEFLPPRFGLGRFGQRILAFIQIK